MVTYRWVLAGATLEKSNQFNAALVDAVRRDGRVFLSPTMLEGRFTLRLAVLSFRSHLRTIDLAQVAALGG